jgi:hypothetical protein
MSFLNIYDLAQKYGISELETSSFVKSKRRILAEIELDDDQVEIRNKTFSKSDVLNLFDEVDKNNQILNFHATIFKNMNLNSFLYGTSKKIPTKLFNDPLGRPNNDFIDFISPYYAKQFKVLYKEAFGTSNIQVLKYIPEVSSQFLEEVYSPILKIIEDFKNDLYLSNVKNKLTSSEIEKLNSLPEYFMKSRSDIALKIRSLSVDAWNKNENLDLAFQILDLGFKLKVNQSTKQRLDEDKQGLEDLKQKKKEEEKIEGFIELLNSIEEIKKYSANPSKIYNSLAPKLRKLDFYKAKEIVIKLIENDSRIDYFKKNLIIKNTTTEKVKETIIEHIKQLAKSCRNTHNDYSTAEKFDDLAYEVKHGRKKRKISSPPPKRDYSTTSSTQNQESNEVENPEWDASGFLWFFIIIGIIIFFSAR